MTRLRVGFLGMADNHATRVLLPEFQRLGLQLDALFLVYPTYAQNRRRMLRKLRSAGFLPTLGRIAFAIRTKLIARVAGGHKLNAAHFDLAQIKNVQTIKSCNSAHCRSLLREANLDILLIATDEMVGKKTFEIPRLGTLNAHPGWIPKYRGLGALLRMLEDGRLPAISVHRIDEGVDTGPVILRQTRPEITDPSADEYDITIHRAQAECFVQAISLLADDHFVPPDTFFEPSAMTRGLTAKHTKKITRQLRKGNRQLTALD